MLFNLKKYITEKYLTERLQSDILINEILNDKGKMFYYYKMPYEGTTYDKAYKCNSELRYIVSNVFDGFKDDKPYDKISIYNEYIDTDDKMIALHNKYMKLYNQYYDYMKKMFMKPDPLVVFTLTLEVSKTTKSFRPIKTDIFNVTDEHFKKYTLKEIKKNKKLKQKVSEDVKTSLVFWFNSEGKILVVSNSNLMCLYAIDNTMCFNSVGKRLPDYIDFTTNMIDERVCNENNFIIKTLLTELSDGTKLDWPIVNCDYFYYNNKRQNLYGFDFVTRYLSIAYTNVNNKVSLLPVGSFTSKASQLYKMTNWGESLDDYVIIYYPEQSQFDKNDPERTISKVGGFYVHSNRLKSYNDFIIDPYYNKHKAKRISDYELEQKRVYKWVKDILGKYKPYAFGRLEKVFEFGKKLSTINYNNLYGNDKYCSSYAMTNIERYKQIIERNKSILGLTEFKSTLKIITLKFDNFTKTGTLLSVKIKSLIKIDLIKFQTAIFLYGTYMKVLNSALSIYGTILVKIKNYNDNYLNIKDKEENSLYDDSYFILNMKYEYNEIERYIKNLLEICNEMTEIQDKINKTIEE